MNYTYKTCFVIMLNIFILSFFQLWGNDPLAILRIGPEKKQAVSNIIKSQPNLYGVYTIDNKPVEVWAVYSILTNDDSWQNTSSAGIVYNAENTMYSTQVELRNVEPYMSEYLYWTLYFSFSNDVQPDNALTFIGLFSERFAYFGSLSTQIGDVSFPAIIQSE